MNIKFHKNFEKRFKKLNKKIQDKTLETIDQFSKDPYHKSLANHPLTGNLKGKRAISVTGDYRIIFEEHANYILVIMLDIGTHNQVY